MIYGEYNSSLQIQLDPVIRSEDGEWVYGAFNFIIDGVFYPGREIHWTLNIAIDWLKSLLGVPEHKLYLKGCEKLDYRELFRNAVISRIGYFYNTPDVYLDEKERKKLYPSELGVELGLYEISDTGLEMYLFRGDEKDILIYSFNDEIFKIELEKGYLHRLIESIPQL